jgi:hypothetical protein
MNRISINGLVIESDGLNIVVRNGKVTVDGKSIEIKDDKRDVYITGNVGSVECDGSCDVKGNVGGNVDAGGSVECGDVGGSVDAGGSVTARNVKNNIDAGGSVHIVKEC